LLANLFDTLKATIELTQDGLRISLVLGNTIEQIYELDTKFVWNILAGDCELIIVA
jgi:hypothetical protein